MSINIERLINKISDTYSIGSENFNPTYNEVKYHHIERFETQTNDEKKLKLREISLEYSLDNMSKNEYNKKKSLIEEVLVDDNTVPNNLRMNTLTKNLNRKIARCVINNNTEEDIFNMFVKEIEKEFNNIIKDIELIDITHIDQLQKEIYDCYKWNNDIDIYAAQNNNINYSYIDSLIGNYQETHFLKNNMVMLAPYSKNIIFHINRHLYNNGQLYIEYFLDIINIKDIKLLNFKDEFYET